MFSSEFIDCFHDIAKNTFSKLASSEQFYDVIYIPLQRLCLLFIDKHQFKKLFKFVMGDTNYLKQVFISFIKGLFAIQMIHAKVT